MDDAAKCKAKMDAASSLINGLAGERVRWTEQLAQFKSEIERLVGDCLILFGENESRNFIYVKMKSDKL